MIDALTILSKIRDTRILVVGDLILDHYIRGVTERTSPEAPVPVVVYQGESLVPGGAANVARNLHAAGADVDCVGIVGGDQAGLELAREIQSAGIRTDGIVTDPAFRTVKKTRVVSQGQQIMRLDREGPAVVSSQAETELAGRIADLVRGRVAVIVSDYAKGVVSHVVFQAVVECATREGIPVFVDPKGTGYRRYRGATVLTPNAREAADATGFDVYDSDGLERAGQSIFRETGCRWLVITMGAQGLAVFENGKSAQGIPASAREVFDVTGAGDTFVAWLAMGTAAGLGALNACRIANSAAGIAVGKSGAAVVTPWDIRSATVPGGLGRKLIEENGLAQLTESLRGQGKTLVFTNGCFDFLHAGHVAFLQQAKAMGDVLIVGMNDDAGIRRLKGPLRPIIPASQRESLLASVEAVDYLVPFSEDTPRGLIETIRPDILVKGGNYSLDQVEGAEIVRAYGGRVATVPIVHEISTWRLAPMIHRDGDME